MNIGICPPTFATDGWRLPAERLLRYVRRAEDLGFSGIWVTEHLLKPPSRNYSRLAPYTTLATMAGTTSTIPIGTSVLLLPLRNPVLAAHRAATLQHLSGNRLTLGFGLGWVEAEFEAVGVPFEERGPRFTEALELVRRLLEGGETTFHGTYYDVESVRIEPTPERPPRILVGGGAVDHGGERRIPRAIKDRILHHSDGWIAKPLPTDHLESDWAEIADYLVDHGRNPEDIHRVALNWLHLVPGAESAAARREQRRVFVEERGTGPERTDAAMRNQLSGSVEEVRERIAAYERLGFEELIIGPTTTDPDAVDRQLEYWATELR